MDQEDLVYLLLDLLQKNPSDLWRAREISRTWYWAVEKRRERYLLTPEMFLFHLPLEGTGKRGFLGYLNFHSQTLFQGVCFHREWRKTLQKLPLSEPEGGLEHWRFLLAHLPNLPFNGLQISPEYEPQIQPLLKNWKRRFLGTGEERLSRLLILLLEARGLEPEPWVFSLLRRVEEELNLVFWIFLLANNNHDSAQQLLRTGSTWPVSPSRSPHRLRAEI